MCRARIIAISFKDVLNPKLGLTMRQQGLGRLEWVKEDLEGKAPEKEEKEGKEKEHKEHKEKKERKK